MPNPMPDADIMARIHAREARMVELTKRMPGVTDAVARFDGTSYSVAWTVEAETGVHIGSWNSNQDEIEYHEHYNIDLATIKYIWSVD